MAQAQHTENDAQRDDKLILRNFEQVTSHSFGRGKHWKHKMILQYFQHMPSNLHNTHKLQVPEATAN